MDNNFYLKINCVVLSTDQQLSKRYILSTDNNTIILPSFYLNKSMLVNLNENIIAFLKTYIFLSDFELLPQLVNLHSTDIENNDESTLNIIYGLVVQNTQSLNNCYWLEFNYFKPNKYINLITEVIQKL